MSFPRFCEYILSIEGALSSHEKRKPQLPPPETECVCGCVCVFPPGATAGPLALVCMVGAPRRIDERPHKACPASCPVRATPDQPGLPRPGAFSLQVSQEGEASRPACKQESDQTGLMPEKQPKETGVQGGKLGRRLVGGGQRLTARLCWPSRLTVVLGLPALLWAVPWSWGSSHSFGLGNWGFCGSEIHLGKVREVGSQQGAQGRGHPKHGGLLSWRESSWHSRCPQLSQGLRPFWRNPGQSPCHGMKASWF